MRYTVNEAAQIVGITRQTIYRHIDSKPISVIKDDNGNQMIEASELMRVYGSDIDFKALSDDKPANVTSNKPQAVTTNHVEIPTSIDDKIQLAKFEMQIENLRQQMEQKDEETDYIKKLLEEEKTERKAANNLLEDHRERENLWNKQFKALEQRIANQEKSFNETQEKYKRAVLQGRGLKKKLDEERTKTFWQKLFG